MPTALSYMLQTHAFNLIDNEKTSTCPNGVNLVLCTMKKDNLRITCGPGGGDCTQNSTLQMLPENYADILRLDTSDFLERISTLPIGIFPNCHRRRVSSPTPPPTPHLPDGQCRRRRCKHGDKD